MFSAAATTTASRRPSMTHDVIGITQHVSITLHSNVKCDLKRVRMACSVPVPTVVVW